MSVAEGSRIEALRRREKHRIEGVATILANEPGRMVTQQLLKCLRWFKKSPKAIQEKLLDLDATCVDFINHLLLRSSIIGSIETCSLQQLEYSRAGIFGFYVVFEVRNHANGSTYCQEYHIWKQGPECGVKGPLFLADDKGAVTHVVVLRETRFGIGKVVFDCPGGFYEMQLTKTANYLEELYEELGIEKDQVELSDDRLEYIDLGQFLPDAALTANNPRLMAGILKMNPAKLQEVSQLCCNLPWDAEKSCALIVPINQIWGANGLIEKNEDGFFLAATLRAFNRGIIPGPATR